jgi:transposase
MLHLGLDLSRKRLDVCVLNDAGDKLAVTQAPPDADGLRHLVKEVAVLGGPVNAAIESMNGARFVHDSLELMGWDVEIADAQKVKGLAPLACKTDRIDAREKELRALGADHPYVSLLQTAPGIAWVLGFTIASEVGDIERFSSPKKLMGYSGLCPRVYQAGGKDFAAHCRRTVRNICAGRSSKLPSMRRATRSTGITTRRPRPVSVVSAARRSRE